MKGLTKILALTLCMAMLLTACSSGTASSSSKSQASSQTTVKDTLTVALKSEATNLDPHNNTSLNSFMIENLIYDRLVDKNTKGEIVPMLATKWEVLDSTTIRFFLRNDVVFSNGEKLTAEDVKYTIARAEVMTASKTYFSSFDGANTKVIDPYTIDIKMKTPFAPVFNYLASARGNIVCKKTMEAVGSDAYGRNPVGSGKMKFSKWVSGDRIELVRNDSYWGTKPSYKNLVLRVIIEPANRAIELETGGVDISFGIDPGDMDRLEKNKDTKIVEGPGYGYGYFAFNTMKFDLFKDIRVREALSIALDIPTLVDSVYKGNAEVANSVLNSKIFSYVNSGTIKYDPEKAKSLLKEAGFDFSKVITISTNEDVAAKDAAEIVQSMWKKIGVNAQIESYDLATMASKTTAGALMFYFQQSSAATGDPDQGMALWISKTSFVHDEKAIFDACALGKATYDTKERAKIYETAQKLAWDYHGQIPISYVNVVYGTRANVQNLDPHPGSTPDLSLITFTK